MNSPIYPAISLDENCIAFEIQRDRNCYVDLRQTYLALKVKLVRGRGYKTYNSKEVKKGEHRGGKSGRGRDGGGRRSSSSRYSCKHFALFFPMLKCTSTINKFTTLMDCMRTNLTFPTTSREPSLNTREFCTARGRTMKNFIEIMEAPLSEPFLTEMKMLSRPDGFMLYGKLGVEFFSTSEFLYPNMKIRLRLIRTRPNFYMISGNPNVSLEIVDYSLYTRRIALKDDYHKKRMDMPAYTPVQFNYLETLAKTFITPARQNQFIQENTFNNAPVRRIAIAMNKLCIHWILY